MSDKDLFFNRLEQALMRTHQYGLNAPLTLTFRGYSREATQKLIDALEEYYHAVIEARDIKGIPRERTVKDCATMSLMVHRELNELGVPSMLIIGGMKIYGELEYNTTYELLEKEIRQEQTGTMNFHVWVITENFLLIDPTFRLKEEERNYFLNKKTNAGLFINDLENFPEEIEYISMLTIDEKFLNKINPTEHVV